MQRWMNSQLGPETTVERLAARMPELVAQLPAMPDLLVDADFELKHLKQLTLQQAARLDALQAEHQRSRRRLLIGAALLVTAGVLWNLM